MASRAQFPNFKAFDINADLLDGGKLYTYDPGTTNPKITYQDAAATSAHTNPIELDSLGESEIFLTGLTKFVLTDAGGAAVDTWNNVEAASTASDTLRTDLAASTGSTLMGWIRTATAAVAHTLAQWLGWQSVSVFEFMTDAEITDVQSATPSLDVTAAIQAALDHASATGNMKVSFPRGHYKFTKLYTFFDAVLSPNFVGNGNIKFIGDGLTSQFNMKNNIFDNGTILESTIATGDCITLSGTTQCLAISFKDMLITGITTGNIIIGSYVPTITFKDFGVTNQLDAGHGISISQCWFSLVSHCIVYNTGAGTPTGTGLVIASGAISGGLIIIKDNCNLRYWDVCFDIADNGWSAIHCSDSEFGNGETAGIRNSGANDTLKLTNVFFEGNTQDVLSTGTLKVYEQDGGYINGGSSTSGSALTRVDLQGGVDAGHINDVYCFRSWSNFVDLASVGSASNFKVSGIQFIHDNISALTKVVTGCVDNGAGLIRVTVTAHGLLTGRDVSVAAVAGTTEANGEWTITVIDANTFDLVASAFVNAYVSGGTSTQLCYVTNALDSGVKPNMENLIATGATADLEASGAYRIISDNQAIGSYQSPNGLSPVAGFAALYNDIDADGTLQTTDLRFLHRRWTTTAATVIDIISPPATSAGQDGGMMIVENSAASTERLQIKQSSPSSTIGYLVPGEVAIVFNDHVNRVLHMMKMAPWQRSTIYGTAAPVAGTWRQGDRVINSAPAAGSPKAWSCTVAGTPGTWVSEGNL